MNGEHWEPGDVVLASDSALWVRANTTSVNHGFAWASVTDYFGRQAVHENYPQRPLTLLVRGGRSVLDQHQLPDSLESNDVVQAPVRGGTDHER